MQDLVESKRTQNTTHWRTLQNHKKMSEKVKTVLNKFFTPRNYIHL